MLCARQEAASANRNRARMSGSFEADVEGDFRVRLSLFKELDRANQLAISDQRALVVILVRVTLEPGIGGEVALRNERPVPWSRNQVVNVLRGTVRVVSGHDRLDGVFGGRRRQDLGAVAVAFDV